MRPPPARPGVAAYGEGAASGGPPAQPGSQSPAAGNPYGEKEEHKGPPPHQGCSLQRALPGEANILHPTPQPPEALPPKVTHHWK